MKQWSEVLTSRYVLVNIEANLMLFIKTIFLLPIAVAVFVITSK